MIIMCDRQDGIFSPQLSDRINVKSTALYEQINNMNVPVIYPKIKVESDDVNVANISIISEKSDSSFSMGPLHVINFRVTFTTNLTANMTTIGRLTTPPNGDIVVSFNDGAWIVIVKKGTQEVKLTTASAARQVQVYFTYVV